MPITEVEKIWMNGELVDWADAKVHLLTHALHYGSGVFEGIRAYGTSRGTHVFRLTEHIERLLRSCKIYMMDVPFSVAELVQATKDVIKANGLESCYIRPIIYRGYGEMGLFPLKAPVDVAIAVWPWGAYLGDEGIAHGIRAKISSFRRFGPNSMPPAAKATGQYINSSLAKVEAVKAGYEEAILLDDQGNLSEGTGENLFVVRKGVVATPPTSCDVLEGITADTVAAICRDEDIPLVRRVMVRSDLYVADEAFLTGTAAEIVPLREVDDRVIGEPGPLTKRIQEVFYGIIKGEDERYGEYLEWV
ncbi:MAG: branched-chain amino acid transaminase [Actinomycetota bacterium]|jgi:branched-chain amino acid aminotransferase|nr:branched-chain amino acid transaminase [Actinomycetota bacterium]MCL6093180.1 branched-chain amino acid transaminase [Actinomycetota bacterium]MDA8166998.1 branched-chain amino acid transaminase [Actinomycetota bacterium]